MDIKIKLPQGGLYTVKDLETINDNINKYEIIDGSLIVLPRPFNIHQHMILKLCKILEQFKDENILILPEAGLYYTEHDYVSPDIIITTNESLNKPHTKVEDVLGVIEIVSPGSRKHDRQVKLKLYAEANIPVYWIIETSNFPGRLDNESLPVILIYQLENKQYILKNRLSAGIIMNTKYPYYIELDTNKLIK